MDDILRSILESPRDDGPRLVLADIYDDRGESEKANTLREQIQDHHNHWSACLGDSTTGNGCPNRRSASKYSPLCPPCQALQNESGLPGYLFGENTLALNRGFPDSLVTSSLSWMGAKCMPSVDGELCKTCKGTGFVYGVAKQVCEVWPLTKLRLWDVVANTTVEPHQASFMKMTHASVNTRNHTAWNGYLQNELFAALREECDRSPHRSSRAVSVGRNIVSFLASSSYAESVLSHAALNYGRKLAGLPPLLFIPSEVLRERNSQYSFAESV